MAEKDHSLISIWDLKQQIRSEIRRALNQLDIGQSMPLTKKEAIEHLGITEREFDKRQIPRFKYGNKYYYKKEDLK